MGDCKNCNGGECCDNCGEGKAPEMSVADKEKAMFLTALGVALEKNGMTWQDVDVDWEAETIDIKVDMDNLGIMTFLNDLHKYSGGFEE